MNTNETEVNGLINHLQQAHRQIARLEKERLILLWLVAIAVGVGLSAALVSAWLTQQ
jgi:hypothetical protein